MAYCTVSDVQKLFGSITFDATTKVTDSDITNIHIPAADALIDAKLRKFYTVPITNESDLALLRVISMNLTAGMVARILYETTTQPNENVPAWERFKIGDNLLDEIVRGERVLATARAETGYSRVEELYQEQNQSNLKPVVTMGKEF